MPPPQATYVARTSNTGYDPATLSDDEDDSASVSSSTWSALAAASDSAIPTLAVLDGKIPSTSTHELKDWKVSRVGGEPSFPLSSPPPIDSRTCLTCSAPMPLVIQLYCPLPHSFLERVVYVFACPRSACQKRREPRSAGGGGPGCVRAWRASGVWRDGEEALRREEEEKRKRDEEDRLRRERKEAASKIQLGGLVFGGAPSPTITASGGAAFNPFAAATPAAGAAFNPFAPASSSTAAANPFGPVAAAAPAASAAANPFALTESAAVRSVLVAALDETKADESTAAAIEQVISTWPPVASSSASSSPPIAAYPPHYVATLYEPMSSKRDTKGKSREAELARAFEADLAIRSGTSSSTTSSNNKTPACDTADDGFQDDFDDRRPGKGSGGRVKKGAARASAPKKPSSAPSGGGGGGGDRAGEGYEIQRVKGVDDVFLRFQERVSREGRQIVRHVETPVLLVTDHAGLTQFLGFPFRYDYSAQPLPYSSASSAYKLLHPSASANSDVGTFPPSQVPPCRYCRGPSAFELQLMPHLALGLDDEYAWATVWVFSCEAECAGGASGDKVEVGEAWREERVLVEWEDEGA